MFHCLDVIIAHSLRKEIRYCGTIIDCSAVTRKFIPPQLQGIKASRRHAAEGVKGEKGGRNSLKRSWSQWRR